MIIGEVTVGIDNEGKQHLFSLYINKDWYGKGLGAALLIEAMKWFDQTKDVELAVTKYNVRARTFYKKFGFVDVPDSEDLYEGLIPDIKMIKKGAKT